MRLSGASRTEMVKSVELKLLQCESGKVLQFVQMGQQRSVQSIKKIKLIWSIVEY